MTSPNSTLLASFAVGIALAASASAATSLYWTDAAGSTGLVRRMELGSPGSVTTVFTAPTQFSGLDSTNDGVVVGGVYGFNTTSVAADATNFIFESRALYDATRLGGLTYYTGGSNRRLSTAPDEFTEAAILFTNDRFTHAIETHAGQIYFSENGSSSGGAINRMNADGTGVVELINGPRTYDLEIFGDHLYYAINDYPTNAIFRANLDGSGVTTLIAGSGFANSLEVTSEGIFWTEFNGPGFGTIKRADLDGTNTVTLLSGLSAVRGLAVVTPVPEPSAASLLAGLGGLGFAALRRRRAR